MAAPLVVLDTQTVVEAVLGRSGGSASRILNQLPVGGLRLALSDAFLSELVRVMSYPRVENRINSAGRAFEMAVDLVFHGYYYRPRRHEWPSIPDANDWWVLDLAFESGADHIVTRDPHIVDHAPALGFDVRTPPQFTRQLGI